MTALLVTMSAALRRLVRPSSVALALLMGALAGLLALSLPSSSLARDVFSGLLAVLAAVLVLPLAAGVPTSERAGGYEQLVALRPLTSLAWTSGRMLGSVIGVATLVMLLLSAARFVGGSRPVPAEVAGQRMDVQMPTPTFRFPLPAGARGPFDMSVSMLAVPVGGAELAIDVARGSGARALPAQRVRRHRAVLVLPDLWPERGDLFVTLRPGAGLVLADGSPQLTVGERTLARHELPLPTGAATALLLGLLSAVAAACAFHFETACLAGLLALAVELPPLRGAVGAAALVLLAFGTLGTSLQRRQALP